MGLLLAVTLMLTEGLAMWTTPVTVAAEEIQTGASEWTNPFAAGEEITAVRESSRVQTASTGVPSYSSQAAAAKYIKKQLKARKESFTFEYTGSGLTEAKLNSIMNALCQKACVVTSSAQEGDYLFYHLRKINMAYRYTTKRATVTWNVQYYSTAAEERQAATGMANAAASLGMVYDSDAIKIKKIHDYICRNVTYYENGTWTQHSAYSAICRGSAVCQGYATLFYAMCKQAGIEVRCVAGTGNGQPHLWNIVKLDGSWYNMDVTWDSTKSGVSYKYFLKSNMDFAGHSRSAEYKTVRFLSTHPIANESYAGNVGIPQIKSVELTADSKVKLRWEPVKTAEGYYIYYSTRKKGGYKKLQTVQGGAYNALTVSGLAVGKTYYFKMRAYTTILGSYTGSESAVKSVKIVPQKVTKLSLAAGKGSLKVKWKAVPKAKGYEIQATYKSGVQTITESLTVSATTKKTQIKTIQNIKSGSRCTVRVRAFATGNNGKKVYGAYSTAKRKTVR